jgi:hypothetical protein
MILYFEEYYLRILNITLEGISLVVSTKKHNHLRQQSCNAWPLATRWAEKEQKSAPSKMLCLEQKNTFYWLS